MNRASEAARIGWRLLPGAVVLVLAAVLLWPVPRGVMPLSADHTVHLTRIVLTAERLVTRGSLSGWDPTWFFGFPLGELYPQLGDLLIIAIHAIGLGALDWPAAYALGFYVVFALQGLVVLRLGRLFGLGPWPGLIAAALVLTDAGFTREAGWMYTVYFGVWPQVFATSLAWLGLGELARALGFGESEATDERAVLWASLSFGGALLAHPIALPSLAIGGVLMMLTLVPRAPIGWRLAATRCLLAGLVGALLAAWWWVPMLQHKAWMASYGWLFAPLDAMLEWLKTDGRWAQRMPAAVGYLALLGVVLASVGVGRVARFVALFAVVQWLLASSDAFWQLRLDRLSEGFTHIQYQRFLIGAKPGLFLCAGLAAAAPAGWAWRLWTTRAERRWPKLAIATALLLAPITAMACGWLWIDSRAAMREYEVGEVQIDRMPGEASSVDGRQHQFEADYREFLAWARAQWDAREHDYRIAVRAPRNSHVFMDAPVWTRTPQYKLGFTPGDNFVHKPESGQRELFDALGVRWIVSLDSGRPRAGEVARFGRIVVREHRGQPRGLAWLEGQGSLELLDADLRRGLVRVRVRGVESGARVVFGIAGYPRWQLSLDGAPLEWFEQPVLGDGPAVLPSARKSGALRGGKAGGDDGSEPTLIAAELPAGTDDAVLELRYDERNGVEWLAEVLSLLSFAWLSLALLRRDWLGWPRHARAGIEALERRGVRMLHPLVVCVLVPALIGLGYGRWQLSAARESTRLLGWVEAGAAESRRIEAGPVKAEMLIRPAVLMRPRPGKPAVLIVELERLPERLTGWIGIDDDQAEEPGRWDRHQLRFEVRWTGSPDAKWYEITRVDVPHRAERIELDVPTGALSLLPVHLRITDEATGKRLPRLGLDLELGEPPQTDPNPD